MTSHTLNESYTIAELESLTGVTPRTIRYYITRGLLSPARGRGPSATYDQDHLNRLQVIQLLRAQHLPLDEIGTRLADLNPRQVATLARAETKLLGESWRRVVLHPMIELQYRESAEGANEALQEAIQLIVELATPIIQRLGEKR